MSATKERELLAELARVAGRINKHKQKQAKSSIASQLAALRASIQRHKLARLQEAGSTSVNSQSEQTPPERPEVHPSLSSASAVSSASSASSAPTSSPSTRPIPAIRYSKLGQVALKRRRLRLRKAKPGRLKLELCRFFTLFGRCNQYSKCPFKHDRSKVANCLEYLQTGHCKNPRCLLRHTRAGTDHNMPVCHHFLKGICSNHNCPYLHVKVADDALPCSDFRNGYCPRGIACSLKHTLDKPHENLERSYRPPVEPPFQDGDQILVPPLRPSTSDSPPVSDAELLSKIKPRFLLT